MKRFLVLFLILIVAIIGFASYPASGTYQDLSGGGFYQWIVVRSVFPDSTLASQLGDTSQYFYRAYIDTLWVNSIRGVDLDSIGTNNPDSLGNRPASAYLINTNDTTATLYISKAYIDSFLDDSISSKSAFKMLNKSIKFTNAAGDTVKALIQGDFVGLYDYVNNVTSVIGNQGFYKYNTAGDSGYFYLRDSSFTFWDYSTQIPVIQMTVTDTGYGEIKVSGTENHLGIYAYGLGVTDTTEDSLVFTLTDEGLNFYRRADQQIYSRFGLNNLTMLDTTGGVGFPVVVMKRDTIYFDNLGSGGRFYNVSNRNWNLRANLLADSLIQGLNGNFTNNLTVTNKATITDSLVTNTLLAESLDVDTIDTRKITADTSYSYRLTGKILKIDSTATIKGGLNLGGGWTAGVDTGYFYNMSHVIAHGNVIIYDDVTLIGDTLSNNQSYFGLSDVTDSSRIQIRPYSLRSFKSLTTASRDTDSTYWGIYNYGYDLLKYATQDTTLKLRDGYIYAKDSIFTGAIKSKSGTDSILITDGTIVVTDSIIGNGEGVITGFDKIQSDSVYVGDNLIRDNGAYLFTTALTLNNIQTDNIYATHYYNASTHPLRLWFNQATNPLIRWYINNADNAADSSAFEDSLPDITGKSGRIKIKRQTTLTKPLINNNMFILSEGRFKDDTVFMLTDTFTTFTSGMQFIDTTGDDSLYTRVRNTWIKQ